MKPTEHLNSEATCLVFEEWYTANKKDLAFQGQEINQEMILLLHKAYHGGVECKMGKITPVYRQNRNPHWVEKGIEYAQNVLPKHEGYVLADIENAYADGYERGRMNCIDTHRVDPIPMRLNCPNCGDLHIDQGEYATKPHHSHACQTCGNIWRPALVATVGVKFLPGFKNKD